ncbi:hypothetical protein BJ875DRAFT_390371 [Amylocarpus encephaloides]|uniref:Uncharacterized protein n=1 Tax=Amylocarpus encephaloides TaxID=45428 RepID=A0A9P8BYS8_9HELO|nr:hypothetical protein BJ875DRAFT_390371 [Amylocarpus encephaloides]
MVHRPLARSKRRSSSPPTSLSTDNVNSEGEKEEEDGRQTTRHAVISIVPKAGVSGHVPPTIEDITRPYISVRKRNVREDGDSPHNDHIDFNKTEVKYICAVVRKYTNLLSPASESAVEELSSLMTRSHCRIPRLTKLIVESLKTGNSVDRLLLRGRGCLGIKSFLTDAAEGRLVATKMPPLDSNRVPSISIYNIGSLLSDRELARPPRGRSLMKSKIKSILEDSLVLKCTWTDSCGDISTISWRNENAFVCGATAHSDHHNMQYNKSGNLLLGSLTTNVVQEVPDHRIPRPRVESQQNRENSLHSMRETQDPWLYTSVVASSYSDFNNHNLTFTASFDKTVKIWRISEHGHSMALLGTWEHKHIVNFVVTSRLHGRVATAADVSVDAIRVYQLPLEVGDVTSSTYHTYNGSRALEQAQHEAQQLVETKWAYYPATIQWGKCKEVKDLLLVGYSPRSLTGDDSDIPEDRKNTGELCLWDIARPDRKIIIPAVRLQNVFEVQWHPTQACFIAATSPSGSCDSNTLTQIRVFVRTLGGEYDYTQTKTLDCSAPDINEITIMPNSTHHSYVTASCTDNNIYVWDTATGDDSAIHVLRHNEPLVTHQDQDLLADGAEGVRFTCWGRTADRLYTGSTDGTVKAWNVRSSEDTFIRDVLKVPGQISSGAFSPNFSKLLIGDATGKIHLLSYDDSDLAGSASVNFTPIQFLQNPSGETKHVVALEELLGKGVFKKHPDPYLGVVQGPNYYKLNLFSPSDHEELDISKPLKWDVFQNQECLHPRSAQLREINSFPRLSQVRPSGLEGHARNLKWEASLRQEARARKLELQWDFTTYDLEDSPDDLKLFSNLSL